MREGRCVTDEIEISRPDGSSPGSTGRPATRAPGEPRDRERCREGGTQIRCDQLPQHRLRRRTSESGWSLNDQRIGSGTKIPGAIHVMLAVRPRHDRASFQLGSSTRDPRCRQERGNGDAAPCQRHRVASEDLGKLGRFVPRRSAKHGAARAGIPTSDRTRPHPRPLHAAPAYCRAPRRSHRGSPPLESARARNATSALARFTSSNDPPTVVLVIECDHIIDRGPARPRW